LRSLADRANEVAGGLAEFCKAVEAGQLELPEGFDPCHSGSGGLPNIPGSSGGSSDGAGRLGGGKTGCGTKSGLTSKGWAADGSGASEIHESNCTSSGCWKLDAKQDANGDMEIDVWGKNSDGTRIEVHFLFHAESGRSTTSIDQQNRDGSGEVITRSTRTDGSAQVTQSTYDATPNHEMLYGLETEHDISGAMVGSRFYERDTPRPRRSAAPHRRRGTTNIPPIGEDGSRQGSGPTIDEVLDLTECQLDKQDRYVDSLLRRYGGSLEEIPDAAENEECQRPDEDSGNAEESSGAEKLTCPGDKEPEGSAPIDPRDLKPNKGDGDGLHQNGGPNVGKIGPLPDVPDALKRVPCVGPNVDCAASVFGLMPGTLFLQMAAVPLWHAGHRLADRLWPW
jgi:hypothetical protein